MSDYIKQLEVAVEELQTKLASIVKMTWVQDPKHKQTLLLMTGPTSWIAKLSFSKLGAVRYRWKGKVACNFQYYSVAAATKEEAIQQIEEKLRT